MDEELCIRMRIDLQMLILFLIWKKIKLTKEFKNAYLHFCSSFLFQLKVELLFMD